MQGVGQAPQGEAEAAWQGEPSPSSGAPPWVLLSLLPQPPSLKLAPAPQPSLAPLSAALWPLPAPLPGQLLASQLSPLPLPAVVLPLSAAPRAFLAQLLAAQPQP